MPSYQPPIHRTQGATALVVRDGGTLDVTSGKILLPANQRRGFIPLPITQARALSSAENVQSITVSASAAATVALPQAGGLLHANSEPRLQMISTVSNQIMEMIWTSAAVVQVNWQVMAPPDHDSATAISMHIIAEKASGATDNKFDFRAWGIGTTDLGSTQSATLTTSPVEYSVNITGLPGHPAPWSFGLAPIAHANLTNSVYAAWVEYNRRSS